MEYVLVTGSAGFIGFHTVQKLLDAGYAVVGVDNLCDYYDVQLKEDRHALLKQHPSFFPYILDICDEEAMEHLFTEYNITYIIHLAAQAGVRYSLEKPHLYTKTNCLGFGVILECARKYGIAHLIYASSSSVYGANTDIPFKESDCVERPLSLYGATKKANELQAYSYSYLYNLPTTGLRFFTVYGPYGRPDMAFFKFTKAIYEEKAIDVYNHGDMMRDFTYIDDIVAGIFAVMTHIPQGEQRCNIFNIGNTHCVALEHCISLLEQAIGKSAKKRYLPMQAGDMYKTYSDVSALHYAVGYTPHISVEEGIPHFVAWYKEYYNIV